MYLPDIVVLNLYVMHACNFACVCMRIRVDEHYVHLIT